MLLTRKKSVLKMQSPSPGSFGAEKWPKATGILFYYERFLKIAIFRQIDLACHQNIA
jgi:hypothetical protein